MLTDPLSTPDATLPLPAAASMVAPLADPRNPSLAAAAADMADDDRESRLEAWKDTLAFFGRLWGYMQPYKGRFILGELAGLGYALFNASIPLLMKIVLDHTVPSAVGAARGGRAGAWLPAGLRHGFDHLAGSSWGVLGVCAIIPAVMIARGLFDYLNNYLVAWISLKVLGDMRRQIFAHINAQSLQFFLAHRSGNLISRVSNDARIVQNALGFIGTDLIKQPITVVGCIYALLYLDWKFTLISLVLFPLCIVPVAVYGKRIRRSGKKEEEQAGEMTVILQETFAGIRVIKSFAREDHQVQQFDQVNNEQFENAIRVRKATDIVGPMVEIVAAIGVGMALFYVNRAGMELTKFLSLATGMFLLYAPIKQLSRMHVQIQKCRSASANIFALLALKPSVQDAPDAAELTVCRGDIHFDGLTFAYEGTGASALHGFDLHIAPGKSVALVGASGAGKTTLLALLQRFYDPDQGAVRVDGRDVRTLTQRSLREQIGVVTQDTFLFHNTIYENIRYGRLGATAEEIHEAARRAYIHDFILTLPNGYETKVGDKGARLSGGQQQRLAIARALLKDAPILLLDEATSALDSESEHKVQDALETLSRGRTVIAIAHRLSTILKADQIIVLDAGQMVEQGSHAELYAQGGRYRRLYDLQFDHEAHLHEMESGITTAGTPIPDDASFLRPMNMPTGLSAR